MNRAAIITSVLGANVQASVPTRKTTARTRSSCGGHPIGRSAAKQRTERGSEEEGGCDQPLCQRREAEVFLHVGKRTVDHSGVVTKQQSTEGGDDGYGSQRPLVVWTLPSFVTPAGPGPLIG